MEGMLDPQGTKFENMDTITNISFAALNLEDKFQDYENGVWENFELAVGEVYSKEDIRKIKKERRPMFPVNYFLPLLLTIMGEFIDNMPGITFGSRKPQDHHKIKTLTQLNNFLLTKANDAGFELAKALLWSLIGRHSWIKHGYDDHKYSEGMVHFEHYDKLLRWDAEHNSRDLSKVNFICDDGWATPEEIIKGYCKNNPELREEIIQKTEMLFGESSQKRKNILITWAERAWNMIMGASREQGYDANQLKFDKRGEWSTESQRLRVIDWYEKKLSQSMYLYDRAGNDKYDITDDVKKEGAVGRYEEWFDREKVEIVRQHFQRQTFIEPYIEETEELKVYQTSIVPAYNTVLYDDLQPVQNKKFKFTQLDCYPFHPDPLRTISLIDVAAPPVKSANLRDNTLLTMVMRMAHGGFWIEEQYANNIEQLKKNDISGISVLSNGAISGQGFKEKPLPHFPEAIWRVKEQAKQDLREVTVVNENAQGKSQTSNEAYKTVAQRIEQTNKAQNWINHMAQAAFMRLCEQNIDYIQHYMTQEQIINITEDASNPYWLIINQRGIDGIIQNDVTTGEFDVVVDIVPFGKAAQERLYMETVDVASFLMQFDPMLVPLEEMIKLSPIKNKKPWMDKIQQWQMQMGIDRQQMEAQNELQYQQQMLQNVSQYSQLANNMNMNKKLIDSFHNIGIEDAAYKQVG